jgi:hypothetical protein
MKLKKRGGLMKKIFVAALVFGFCSTLNAQECKDYGMTMQYLDTYAESNWSICSETIKFSITGVSESFLLCDTQFAFVQENNQFEVRDFSSDDYSFIHFNGTFDGCANIRQGVTISGWVDSFPDWFKIDSPFRIYYSYSYVDINGSPISTTTSVCECEYICPAELIYGCDSPEASKLRFIRDNVLRKTPEGQELIRLYYLWSPVIAQIIDNDHKFKDDMKRIIDNLL